MTVVEIIFAVIACAFVVLIIYLVRLLCTVNCLLKTVKKQVASLGHEPRNLVQHLNQIARNVAYKSKALDPFFGALSHVGEVLEEKSASFAAKRRYPMRAEALQEEGESKLSELVNWLVAGVNVYKKFKKGD